MNDKGLGEIAEGDADAGGRKVREAMDCLECVHETNVSGVYIRT